MHLSVDDMGINPDLTVKKLSHKKNQGRIVELLRSADVGVIEANTSERPLTQQELERQFHPEVIAQIQTSGGSIKGRKTEFNLLHKTEDGADAALDFKTEESAGTRRFFSLLGPWLDILDNGYTVFIDEIDTSLHPLLVHELLKLLFCPKNNPKGAQIVFTTHNPVFLDQTLLRRDQIWFTEKDETGATTLYPLTDYKPRGEEALAKRYLAGVYGGIPFLPEGLHLFAR